MKIIVATKETQGWRKNDFSFVPDGEIVFVGLVCDADHRRGADGGCGCNRALMGSSCHKGTTTVKVVEREMSREEYTNTIADAWVDGSYFKLREDALPSVTPDCDWFLAEADKHDAGTVLEFRAGRFGVRTNRPSTANSGR